MKKRGLKMVGFGLLAIVAVAGFSAAVMLLWNAIVPGIFGLVTINFWQALGLLVLIRILFGGMGGHGRMHRFARGHGRMMGGNPIREKWMNMTPEERKEFVKRHRGHMGHGMHGHGDFFGRRDFEFDDACDPSKKENE